MDYVLLALAISVAFLLGCVLGVFLGITDCKRVFSIPRHATGVDDDGNYTFY